MALINCPECGKEISDQSTTCPNCGYPIRSNIGNTPIVINNTASAYSSIVVERGNAKSKWVALFLCIFTIFGHKFYEGKFGIGILYLFTIGLFGIGWFIDIIALLFKPNPYYV